MRLGDRSLSPIVEIRISIASKFRLTGLEKTVNLKEETDSVEQSSPPSKISSRLVLAVGLLLSIIAGGVWYFHSTPPSGILSLSGRLEGYETDIGAKVPGRINFVAVREGDLVKQGQINAISIIQ